MPTVAACTATCRLVGVFDVDAEGNVWMALNFHGAITIDGRRLIGTESTNRIALAKLDTGGRLQWATVLDVGELAYFGVRSVEAITVDRNGGAVIAGTFDRSATIGSVRLQGLHTNTFVARLNASGETLWAVHTDHEHLSSKYQWSNHLSDVEVDDDGNIYVVGEFAFDMHAGGTVLRRGDR